MMNDERNCPRPTIRRGITLLEVLISILVLSVGILAMATLIPVGAYELSEAAKADATSTLGRAAFRDLEVRKYLSPWAWTAALGQCINSDGTWNTSCGMTRLEAQAFVIDPLMVTLNGSAVARFPYQWKPPYDPAKSNTAPDFVPQQLLLPRVTVSPMIFGASGAISMADRIFRAGDDLILDPANFDRKRPAMTYLRDSSNNAMQTQFTGNYSWFMTLSPSVDEMGNRAMSPDSMWTYYNSSQNKFFGQQGSASDPSLGASSTRQYTATVVVCYKRDMNPTAAVEPVPGERMLLVSNAKANPPINGMFGGGLGGGEVQVRTMSPYSAPSVDHPENAAWLKLRPGQWLMLSGWDPASPNQVFMDWYRIVAVDRGVQLDAGGRPSRFVTLHGADWFANAVPPSHIFATVVEGVIGVYQKTITLDGDSVWSR